MRKTIVVVSGWAKSGKDTLADRLIEVGASRISFADGLKDFASDKYGLPLNYFYEQSLKEMPLLEQPVEIPDKFTEIVNNFLAREFRTEDGQIRDRIVNTPDGAFGFDSNYENRKKLFWTPRALLILEGSIGRAVDKDVWVKTTVNKINGLQSRVVVIPDLRYRNEINSLQDNLGENHLVTVRVNRFKDTLSSDPSERDLDNYNFDYVIQNTGTLSEYMDKIEKLISIESLGRKKTL